MPNVNDVARIQYAKNKQGTDVAIFAKNELFGLKPCGVSWQALLAKQMIIDAYDNTELQYLNTEQKDCLLGKLTADLTTNNCCV